MRILLKKDDRDALQLKLDQFMTNFGAMLINMSNMPKGDGDFSF